MDFYFTDHTYLPYSTVLSDIYYDADTSQLLVVLNSGSMYGYDNVPADVARAFAKQEELGGSAGGYWNEWIKPHYKSNGLTEDDINYFLDRGVDEVPEDEGLIAQAPAVVDEEGPDIDLPKLIQLLNNEVGLFVEDKSEPEVMQTRVVDAPVPGLRAEFGVTFEFTSRGEVYEDDLNLFAATADDALVTFGKIADLAGYENAKVTSVTRFFD